MDINAYQAGMYFNVYMIKSVYFGCGVIELNKQQENELRRLYEEPMLVKLGLSKKYPRTALYSRKSALGVGLMMPSTLIAVLKLKAYIGNKRRLGNTAKSIKIQEEYQEIEAGRTISLGENPKFRYWKKGWIDKVNDELWHRQIRLETSEVKEIQTKNKTVMQYAIEYVEVNGRNQNELQQINYVRLKKGVLIPCELVGAKGRTQTNCYREINEMSPIKWPFNKTLNDRITSGQKKIWEKFIKWLRLQTINTEWDFKVEWRWTINEERSVVKVETDEEIKWYKRENAESQIYTLDENSEIEGDECGCIGRMISKDKLIICDVQLPMQENSQEVSETINEYPSIILDQIQSKVAVAATDAAMEENYIATHWIISTKDNEVEHSGGVRSTEWNVGLIPAGEGIGLLELVKNVNKNTKHLNDGEITIYNDNKKLINEIHKEVMKESECTQEAGGVVEGIRREIKKANIVIKIEYANNKPHVNKTFEQQAGQVLMKKCDEEAKRKCAELFDEERRHSIKHVGIEVPIVKGRIVDKNINVLIREIDAMKNEHEAIKEKVKEKHEWMDVEARNCFHGGVGNGTLNCVVGFNHHGKRNGKINEGLTSSKCPRCGQEEDWEHVILCNGMQGIKEQYIKEMKGKMLKIAKQERERQLVELIVKDIETYVNQESNEYTTTQHVVGMDLMFKGWVIKNWLNVQQKQEYIMKKINKIIVKCSVMFYSKAWMHRNEIMHDADKYKEYVVEWHKRIVNKIERGNKPSMRRYLRMQKIDVNKCDVGYIQLWNESTMKMFKQAKSENENDIRNYFAVR